MDIIKVQQNLQSLYNQASEVYGNESTTKQDFIRLDRQKKSRFNAIRAGKEGTQSDKDMWSFCSKEWTEFEMDLIQAECKWIGACSAKDAYEAKLDILRSLNKKFDIN